MGQEMAGQGTLRGLNYKLAKSMCPPQSQQVKFALPILCEKLWQLGEFPEDWRKSNVTPIVKKSHMDHPEHYRLVSLLMIPGKVMGKTVLEIISKLMKVKKVTGRS